MTALRYAVGAVTDVGRGRPHNEDAFLIDDIQRLYAVADGMGGHRAGEVASAIAIEELRATFVGGTPLAEAIGAANTAVLAKAGEHPEMRGMGTTMTAVNLTDNGALLGHVGDSRAYLFRDGGPTRVTEDHSLVEQLVRDGRISPDEARDHPQRAIITRALGVETEVEVDTYHLALRPGDRLVLCSDGLTNMVSEPDMAGVLRTVKDPQQAAQKLVDLANEAGGGDNITVVLVDAHQDDGTGDEPAVADQGVRVGLVEEVPADPAASTPDQATGTGPPGHRTGRLRRTVMWALPVSLILAAGVGAVGWYARQTYYVGFDGGRVVLYQGVPGGLLGWSPTVEDRTELRASDLTEKVREDLESGQRFSSRAEAEDYIGLLRASYKPTDDALEFSDPFGPDPRGATNPTVGDR